MEKKSYSWFERRKKTKALELAQEQITEALDTVNLLNQAVESVSLGKIQETTTSIDKLFKKEEEVDELRVKVFKELSSGAARFSDIREDLMHLVTRLDTFADYVKDAARCVRMLMESEIPRELWDDTLEMTKRLVDCTTTLRRSIEHIVLDPNLALAEADKVEEIETEIDNRYLEIKSLFIEHGKEANCGALIIFNSLVEFIEEAADMCADTADYIIILSSS
jgi:predicted phosphate transport protein (TIGR00153 family)